MIYYVEIFFNIYLIFRFFLIFFISFTTVMLFGLNRFCILFCKLWSFAFVFYWFCFYAVVFCFVWTQGSNLLKRVSQNLIKSWQILFWFEVILLNEPNHCYEINSNRSYKKPGDFWYIIRLNRNIIWNVQWVNWIRQKNTYAFNLNKNKKL